jgi:hypothetical protein
LPFLIEIGLGLVADEFERGIQGASICVAKPSAVHSVFASAIDPLGRRSGEVEMTPPKKSGTAKSTL